MVMDSQLWGSPDGYQSVNGGVLSPGLAEPLNSATMLNNKEQRSRNPNLPDPPSPPFDFAATNVSSSPGTSVGVLESPDDSDSDDVLKYISQILMEEDLEGAPCMFHDSLALQAAEKPFYDALGEKYPTPDQRPLVDHYVESPDDHFSGFSSDLRYVNGSTSTATSADFTQITHSTETKPFFIEPPLVGVGYCSKPPTPSPWPLNTFSTFGSINNGPLNYFTSPVEMDIYHDRESMMLFQKGMDEASKFLPKNANVVIDLGGMTIPDETKEAQQKVVKREKCDPIPDGSRGRKAHYRDDEELEERRSSKQSAVSVEEDELSEMFDRVLLCPPGKHEAHCTVKLISPKEEPQSFQNSAESQGYDNGNGRSKNHGSNSSNVVDVRSLLLLCAQAAASDDRRTANEILKQIRQHSSQGGDASQRLAHHFANALEARLTGTGSQICTELNYRSATAAEILRGYQVFVSICPIKKMPIIFANHTILKLAKEEKVSKLHIIDFGILYGFQWPILIQRLSELPGGPPKLRITGIEFPRPGFRPAERVEATGRRLAKYCKRFNVPFEYHAIARKWETIKVEDLKISSDEVVAVNCLYRFRYLLDETIVVNSPRDAVLNLIRKINPNVFVHGIVNGNYSSPFFITRFREALFHYSALFDLFDATGVCRDDPDRALFEQEFFGREIMYVVACEGTERIERPETYKQWQVRNIKAGLKPLPLDPELVTKLRLKIKEFYHKDYWFDVDGYWALLGWKGRIGYGVSAWVSA